jgi:hypothetical protein
MELLARCGSAEGGETNTTRCFGRGSIIRLKWLKQLDRIAGRILDEDLLAAVAGDNIVAKTPS